MENNFYNEIKSILICARNKVYKTTNFAMVEAYWNIGKRIIAEQGGKDTAEYGQGLLQELSKQMIKDFGRGFTITNLKYMRQFYLAFPNGHALRDELSWTHYRSLMRVENEKARNFYLEETVKSNWSTRQQRFTFDGRHFRIDLVFYNYILKCFVLIDLKIGDLTHQDLGQMQMYVHYYEREMMNEVDNPPIGIVLCADKSDSIVKYTLPEDEKQIFASKYKLYLPSEEELLNELNKEYLTIEGYANKEKEKK